MLRFVIDYGKNLWFIVWTTVPLMLLAGFLGAVVATLLPNDLLRNVPFGFVVLFMASLVGTFLPVPIGFDVAVAGALLNGGLGAGLRDGARVHARHLQHLLVLHRGGRDLAARRLLLGALIVALGMVAGLGAHGWHQWQSQARARNPDQLQVSASAPRMRRARNRSASSATRST